VASVNKKLAGQGRENGGASAFTIDLSSSAKAMLKRLARHRRCSAALIERLTTKEEHRVVASLKGKALKAYYGD
jgi:stress-induced morphogen